MPLEIPDDLARFAGAPQVMRAEALDPDLADAFGDDGPDGPVAQAGADLPTFEEGP